MIMPCRLFPELWHAIYECASVFWSFDSWLHELAGVERLSELDFRRKVGEKCRVWQETSLLRKNFNFWWTFSGLFVLNRHFSTRSYFSSKATHFSSISCPIKTFFGKFLRKLPSHVEFLRKSLNSRLKAFHQFVEERKRFKNNLLRTFLVSLAFSA